MLAAVLAAVLAAAAVLEGVLAVNAGVVLAVAAGGVVDGVVALLATAVDGVTPYGPSACRISAVCVPVGTSAGADTRGGGGG